MSSAQNPGTFRKSVRRHKTPPNRKRAPSGMRRTPSKSLAPTDRDGSQELSPLLSWSFSLRWPFDSSHRDRTTCTTCPPRILLFALLQTSKRNRFAGRAFGLRRRRPPTPSAAACVTPSPPSWVPGLSDRDGRRPVPVELKSSACPRSGPHAARVAQLMTYCVLVEDAFARPVPHGVLQYSDARRQIPFTADRKREVLQFTDEIRRKRGSATCTGNINTLVVVGSSATGLCAKTP